MKYSAPVLLEVGQAATLVLGPAQGDGDSGAGDTKLPELALGLDD